LPLALAATGLFWPPHAAFAAFHLWSVTEIYSSADGSVQYVKLATSSTLENGVGGHAITCSGPLGTHSFTIPSSLSSSATAGKTFLIGTPNLATVPGGVTPDFVFTNTVPFLFVNGGGTTSVGITGSFQTPATYTVLPPDGVTALNGSGASVVNLPKNFSDQSNSIVPVKFSSALVLNTNFVMSFRTATGVNGSTGPNYHVEYKDSLTSTNWSSLATVPGNGTTKSVSNALSSASQRFFRLHAP
jgi:hypothetical protein